MTVALVAGAGGTSPGVATSGGFSWTLNGAQTTVLRWIADGCPAGVMGGYDHRTSAAALRTRNLVRISGHGEAWRAELTPAGRAYLENPPPAERPRHRKGQEVHDTAWGAYCRVPSLAALPKPGIERHS